MTVPLSNFRPYGADREIVEDRVKESRPLFKVHYSRPRHHFIDRYNEARMSTTDAMEHTIDYRPFAHPMYERAGAQTGIGVEHDLAVQAVCATEDKKVQTPWFRKVNSAIQVQTQVIDARVRNDEAADEETQQKNKNIESFLGRVFPKIEHNIICNNTLELFRDDYTLLMDDDNFLGNKEDAVFIDFGNFQHHKYTKGLTVTSMDWKPSSASSKGGVICIAVGQAFGGETDGTSGYMKRLALNRKVLSSLVVIWDFSDPIHPRWVLESPQEVNVVKFNPTNDNIIVGGCANGQVVVWDLTKQTQKDRKGKKGGRDRDKEKEKEREEQEAGDGTTPRIMWKEQSKIETSHKRAVQDIAWIQGNLECNFDGKLVPSGQPGSESNKMKRCWGGTDANPYVFEGVRQFITLSSDGNMFVWDLNKENMRKDKQRKLVGQGKTDHEIPWIPLIKLPLTKPDGSGEIIGLKIHLEDKSIDPYLAAAVTEEGEFVNINWAPHESTNSSSNYGAEETTRIQPVKMCAGFLPDGRRVGHHSAGRCVQRHPQLPDYYLTAGDWCFKIWKVGHPIPIVCSPYIDAEVTAGCWSPTRASVVLLGTSNGKVQVWDLLDRSHEPVLTQAVSQDAVTCMAFKPATEGKKQQASEKTEALAVGTRIGFLHVFRLPKVMVKPKSHEKADMERYLEREVSRVKYYDMRWEKRAKEVEAKNAQVQQDAALNQGAKKDGEDGAEETNPYEDPVEIESALAAFKELLMEGEEED